MHSGDSSVSAETDVANGRYRTFLFYDANTDSPKYGGSFYMNPNPDGININLDDINTLKNVRYYPASYFNFDSNIIESYGDPWCYIQRDGTNIYIRCRILLKNITSVGWTTPITITAPTTLPNIWTMQKVFHPSGLATFDCHSYNKQIDMYLIPDFNNYTALIEISGNVEFG